MSISREVLAKYIAKGDLFIETGTRWGDTLIKAIELGAARAFSCESDIDMLRPAIEHCKDALAREAAEWDITCSNSVLFLQDKVVPKQRSVVFLDAHTESYSPLVDELKAIARWEHKPKVILIDDLRCMDAWKVNSKDLLKAVRAIGQCDIGYEDGVVEKDILVACYS